MQFTQNFQNYTRRYFSKTIKQNKSINNSTLENKESDILNTLSISLTFQQLNDILNVENQQNQKEGKQQINSNSNTTVHDVLSRQGINYYLKFFKQKFTDWQHDDIQKYLRAVELEHVMSNIMKLSQIKSAQIVKKLDEEGLLMAVTQSSLMELMDHLSKLLGVPRMTLQALFYRLDLDGRQTRVLSVSLSQVDFVVKTLRSLGASEWQIVQIVTKQPVVLKDFQVNILLSNYIQMRKFQMVQNEEDFFALCIRNSRLLSANIVQNLQNIFVFFRTEVELTTQQIYDLVHKEPKILSFHLPIQIVRAKFQFLKNELGGNGEDALCSPVYLTSPLDVEVYKHRILFLQNHGYRFYLPSQQVPVGMVLEDVKWVQLQSILSKSQLDFGQWLRRLQLWESWLSWQQSLEESFVQN
eukprot:TRINITY_DN6832_c0_g1_i5.p1 TRINITY_DN6832_c0_g1~~TRINITY_DN6832_c0_g1_i5.p1  ORF type:complete len:412 (-),score=25.51 TRINITY_DN6832_c0_g1_i5:188-1423(-)